MSTISAGRLASGGISRPNRNHPAWPYPIGLIRKNSTVFQLSGSRTGLGVPSAMPSRIARSIFDCAGKRGIGRVRSIRRLPVRPGAVRHVDSRADHSKILGESGRGVFHDLLPLRRRIVHPASTPVALRRAVPVVRPPVLECFALNGMSPVRNQLPEDADAAGFERVGQSPQGLRATEDRIDLREITRIIVVPTALDGVPGRRLMLVRGPAARRPLMPRSAR